MFMYSFNPYCSGRWSRTPPSGNGSSRHSGCLNPYCNGRWSRTQRKVYNRRRARVLILIVVEDGLVHMNKAVMYQLTTVLILVVMEDGLVLPIR